MPNVSLDRFVISNDGQFSTLEIMRSTLDDSGTYTATATNENGSVSCRCNLFIDKHNRAHTVPEFIDRLDEECTMKCGDNMHLTAHVEAYPSVSAIWYRNGVRIRPSRRMQTTVDKDGFIQLIISNVVADDAGTYKCVATNEAGYAHSECQVFVQNDGATIDPPTDQKSHLPYSSVPLFVKKPRSFEAFEGDTVIIDLEVVGDPKPDVIWLRDFLKVRSVTLPYYTCIYAQLLEMLQK